MSSVTENIPSVTIVEVISSVDVPSVEVLPSIDIQMPVLSKPKLPSKDNGAQSIPLTKSARQKERRERIVELGNLSVDDGDLETCCFTDWSTHESENVYWSWCDFSYVHIMKEPTGDDCSMEINRRRGLSCSHDERLQEF